MHLNTPNLSKFVQISFTWKFSLQSLSLSESSKNPSPSPPLFLIISPYWPLVSIAFWTIFIVILTQYIILVIYKGLFYFGRNQLSVMTLNMN